MNKLSIEKELLISTTFFLRERNVAKKAPAVPSSCNGNASTCKPLLTKAVFAQNEEFLQAARAVPKNADGIGLWRKPLAADMPADVF